jgi:hypothetical protein
MIKFKKPSIILFLLLISACGGGNIIKDVKTLEQKALEIPPNFELEPPSDNNEITKQIDQPSESEISDVEEILGTGTVSNQEEASETDAELLDILIGDTTN